MIHFVSISSFRRRLDSLLKVKRGLYAGAPGAICDSFKDASIEENHRNPSKYNLEEHDMLNWLKANRKRMNANELKPERVEMFEELQELMEHHRRVNQWV